jgi:hypothetical protein
VAVRFGLGMHDSIVPSLRNNGFLAQCSTGERL